MSENPSSGQPLPGPGDEDVTKLRDLAPEARKKVYTSTATITAVDKQKKVARFRHFEFWADEPQWLGGEDQHPQPLTYLVAGVGF